MIADAQTAGRGRRAIRGCRRAGSGLRLRGADAPRARAGGDTATTLVTLAAGVALAQGSKRHRSSRRSQVAQRSLRRAPEAGRHLAEGVSDAVVVGYGINVGATAFRLDLAGRATPLESELGRRSIARTCSPRRSRRSRAGTTTCSTAGSMLSSTSGAPRPRSRGAASRGRRRLGTQNGVTAGIDRCAGTSW